MTLQVICPLARIRLTIRTWKVPVTDFPTSRKVFLVEQGSASRDSEEDTDVEDLHEIHKQVLKKKHKQQPWKMEAGSSAIGQEEKDNDSQTGGG